MAIFITGQGSMHIRKEGNNQYLEKVVKMQCMLGRGHFKSTDIWKKQLKCSACLPEHFKSMVESVSLDSTEQVKSVDDY